VSDEKPTISVYAINEAHQAQANELARNLPKWLDDVAELREAAEELAAWVESGPNASKAMQLRAVLAKVKP
jgi:hypothetical protein